jgi:hypothetical protein
MADFPRWMLLRDSESSEETDPEPLTIRAGDTATWHRAFHKYSAAEGWTLQYVLNSPSSRIVMVAGDVVSDGEGFRITVPSAETKQWPTGEYQWIAVVTSADERFTVALGRVKVEIDILDATSPQDTRTANERALANIDLMLAGRGGDGVLKYKIHERELERYSLTQLLELRAHFKRLVRQERFDSGEKPLPTTIVITGW